MYDGAAAAELAGRVINDLYLLSRNLRKASKRNTMVFLRNWRNDNLITI
jgi:hypothetical protein